MRAVLSEDAEISVEASFANLTPAQGHNIAFQAKLPGCLLLPAPSLRPQVKPLAAQGHEQDDSAGSAHHK